MNRRSAYVLLFILPFVLVSSLAWCDDSLPTGLEFVRGAVNRVVLTRGEGQLVVYGATTAQAPATELLLLTHGRRDVVWAARGAAESGVKIVAPTGERYWLEQPQAFWDAFTTKRFHDYGQQSTKVVAQPLSVAQWAEENQPISWRGLSIRTIATPGFTRGSASYVVELDGKTIAFTGDLIYGDGQLLDLYSFQDAIPEANVRGYHGYGSRLASLVTSLKKVAAAKPDLIVPARGPLIRNPQAAIANLTSRVQKLYHNYLSTNALHWYFKKKRMQICGERVLGAGAKIDLMPYANHQQTPNWVFEKSTSRLLISDTGNGFLIDCGNQGVIDAIKDLIAKKLVAKVEGIFVTHYHDDHTNSVQAAAEEFGCPVFATSEYADILERPEAYHMPAMTSNAIEDVVVMTEGQTVKWHEFELTYFFFPGQAFYHGAMLAKKENERPIFFIGDAFAPSGLDDYCVLNRNLVHEDDGYLKCLQMVRQASGKPWLVNEHIPYVFEFSKAELDYLESRYRERIETLRELFPWDDPNYGIDEQWAVFYPYGVKVAPAAEAELEVRLTNHSAVRRTFEIQPHGHGGIEIVKFEAKLELEPRQTGSLKIRIKVPRKAGNRLVTADVKSDGMDFRHWVEALITVE
jgi:glyoxylase-like metal-dependent hydrolase (beta-lactamase superfamily II)